MTIHSYIAPNDDRKNCLTEYKKERKEILDEFLCNECYDEVIADYDDYDDYDDEIVDELTCESCGDWFREIMG